MKCANASKLPAAGTLLAASAANRARHGPGVPASKPHLGGFTLWELLVTMFIVGIILGVGIPNFMTFTRNSAMASGVNGFVSALHLSRTEAIKRRVPVTLCASPDPLAAEPSCDVGGTGGFFAFVDADDTDGDGIADGDGVFDAGEEIVLQRDPPDESITLTANGDYLTYAANGFIADMPGLAAPISMVLFCDDRGNADTGFGESVARAVAISGTGRPTLLRSLAGVSQAAAATGGACP